MKMPLIGFLITFSLLVLAESARFGSISYPRVPVNNKREITSSLRFGELPEEGLSKRISLGSIGTALKPLQGYLSVGVALLALLKLAQERGLLDAQFVFPRFAGQTADVKKEDDLVVQLKKDQDEVWSAILNIHNTQKDNKALIDATTESVTELRDTHSRFAEQHQHKIEEINSRLNDVERSLFELSQNVMELSQSVDTKELREQVRSVEDRLQRESVATAASVRQVREELPELMQKHDHMMTEKLSRFKDDLKQLLANRHTNVVTEVTKVPPATKTKKKSKK